MGVHCTRFLCDMLFLVEVNNTSCTTQSKGKTLHYMNRFFFVHPPVLSSAPFRESRNHGITESWPCHGPEWFNMLVCLRCFTKFSQIPSRCASESGLGKC